MTIEKQHTAAKINKINNFDLIRLFAALQVVLSHSGSHFEARLPRFLAILDYFPGVPIFFGISGFLITSAYLRNTDFKTYMRNRILRIYPALWVCLLVTIVAFFCFGVVNISSVASGSFVKWLICQLTFFQFYTPEFLKVWGVGSPNGSLWTITVELQFYLFLPLLIWTQRKWKRTTQYIFLLVLMLLSIAAGLYYTSMNPDSVFTKLFHVTLAPYLHYFILGILSCLGWSYIQKYFEGKFWVWFAIYMIYIIVFSFLLKLYEPSYYSHFFGWLSNFLLWCLIMATAFTNVDLSERLLRKNDISYGVYIYHMIVINSLLSLPTQHLSAYAKMGITVISTCLLAFLSWKLVEKPILNLKKK